MKLSYYQQIKQAIERIESGYSVVAYAGGHVELRAPTYTPGSTICLTFKMWNKVSNHFGGRLEMMNHLDGVYASFKLSA